MTKIFLHELHITVYNLIKNKEGQKMINQVAFTGKNTLINSFKEFQQKKHMNT